MSANNFASQTVLLLNVVHDLRITNAITIASLVILVYDIFLTFSDEVEYVWNAKWTYGKALFFLNRYPIVAVSVILIASDMDVASDLKMLVLKYYMEESSVNQFGSEDARSPIAWKAAFIIPVQLVFCLRTTALWERSQKILAFLVALLLVCDTVIGVFIWMSERTVHFMFPQVSGLRDIMSCYADISDGTSPKVIIPAVAALMIFDAAILILTILRFIRIRRDGEGKGFVVRTLFRDGLIYYIVVLVSSIANLILYAVLPTQHAALLGALVPLLRTVMSVCASRLMLNLRGAIDRSRTYAWSTEEFRSTDAAQELEHGVMELELRLFGPNLGHQYREQVRGGSTSPAPTRTTLRPRSTTVVEVVTGKDKLADTETWKRAAIVEDGAVFDIVYTDKDDTFELPMGVAV